MSDEFDVSDFEAPPPDLSKDLVKKLFDETTTQVKRWLDETSTQLAYEPAVRLYLSRKGLQQDLEDRIFDYIDPFLHQLLLNTIKEVIEDQLAITNREVEMIEDVLLK